MYQAPGAYTFPLVYGNALNGDGSSNSTSYGTSTFVDHNGVQITSPYIYSTNGGANVPYDACIVWQDAPHLITPSSVQLTSDKHSIQFTVERKNICAGNCVIAVRDKDKNIMWSWHIWVTDHNMTNTYEVHNNSSVGGEVVSNFMEVPLGWCDDEVRVYDPRTFHITVKQTETGGQTATANITQLSSDSTYTYGVNAPCYQWGRKDPFVPSNGISNIEKPCYDNSYTACIRSSGAVATNIAILHPNVFYFVLDASWSSTNKLDFWNFNNTATTNNNNTVYKTIYSPSPTGYVEPKPAAFSAFSKTGTASNTISEFNVSGSYNKGWNFYCQPNFLGSTIFFSSLGYRNVYSGDVNNTTGGVIAGVGTNGIYWSSGPSSTSVFARYISTAYNYVAPRNENNRAAGLTLRVVLE